MKVQEDSRMFKKVQEGSKSRKKSQVIFRHIQDTFKSHLGHIQNATEGSRSLYEYKSISVEYIEVHKI